MSTTACVKNTTYHYHFRLYNLKLSAKNKKKVPQFCLYIFSSRLLTTILVLDFYRDPEAPKSKFKLAGTMTDLCHKEKKTCMQMIINLKEQVSYYFCTACYFVGMKQLSCAQELFSYADKSISCVHYLKNLSFWTTSTSFI